MLARFELLARRGRGVVKALTAAWSTAASLPARAKEWRIAASVYNYGGGRSQRVT